MRRISLNRTNLDPNDSWKIVSTLATSVIAHSGGAVAFALVCIWVLPLFSSTLRGYCGLLTWSRLYTPMGKRLMLTCKHIPRSMTMQKINCLPLMYWEDLPLLTASIRALFPSVAQSHHAHPNMLKLSRRNTKEHRNHSRHIQQSQATCHKQKD